MAKAWVVYESMFGNTGLIAAVIAKELGQTCDVGLHEVSEAGTLPPDLDLLVVGAPTHAFGLSRPPTRENAAYKSGRTVESSSMGVREWLDSNPTGGSLATFATFDTRVSHPRVAGSAATKAARKLRRLGLVQAVPPVTFWVHGVVGPLDDGEVDRSRGWARSLAEAVSGSSAAQPVA
jgi:hypothetical protein